MSLLTPVHPSVVVSEDRVLDAVTLGHDTVATIAQALGHPGPAGTATVLRILIRLWDAGAVSRGVWGDRPVARWSVVA